VSTPAFQATPDGTTQGNHLNVVGSSDFPNPGALPNAPTVPVNTGTANSNGNNQTLDIVWGDQDGNHGPGDGTYAVAQFTIVGNTGAFIRGYSGTTASGNSPVFFPNNGTGAIAAASQGTMYLPIRGDVDLDGFANQNDLNTVLGRFNKPGTPAQGDLNADGFTNQIDLNLVLTSFGNGIGAPPAGALGALVPEPTIGGLVLGGMLAGFARRRNRQ